MLNASWTIYTPHLSTLKAVSKMHCLYANAVVQACGALQVTWYERQRLILNADTVTFVYINTTSKRETLGRILKRCLK